jgi:hypothetical protein
MGMGFGREKCIWDDFIRYGASAFGYIFMDFEGLSGIVHMVPFAMAFDG